MSNHSEESDEYSSDNEVQSNLELGSELYESDKSSNVSKAASAGISSEQARVIESRRRVLEARRGALEAIRESDGSRSSSPEQARRESSKTKQKRKELSVSRKKREALLKKLRQSVSESRRRYDSESSDSDALDKSKKIQRKSLLSILNKLNKLKEKDEKDEKDENEEKKVMAKIERLQETYKKYPPIYNPQEEKDNETQEEKEERVRNVIRDFIRMFSIPDYNKEPERNKKNREQYNKKFKTYIHELHDEKLEELAIKELNQMVDSEFERQKLELLNKTKTSKINKTEIPMSAKLRNKLKQISMKEAPTTVAQSLKIAREKEKEALKKAERERKKAEREENPDYTESSEESEDENESEDESAEENGRNRRNVVNESGSELDENESDSDSGSDSGSESDEESEDEIQPDKIKELTKLLLTPIDLTESDIEHIEELTSELQLNSKTYELFKMIQKLYNDKVVDEYNRKLEEHKKANLPGKVQLHTLELESILIKIFNEQYEIGDEFKPMRRYFKQIIYPHFISFFFELASKEQNQEQKENEQNQDEQKEIIDFYNKLEADEKEQKESDVVALFFEKHVGKVTRITYQLSLWQCCLICYKVKNPLFSETWNRMCKTWKLFINRIEHLLRNKGHNDLIAMNINYYREYVKTDDFFIVLDLFIKKLIDSQIKSEINLQIKKDIIGELFKWILLYKEQLPKSFKLYKQFRKFVPKVNKYFNPPEFKVSKVDVKSIERETIKEQEKREINIDMANKVKRLIPDIYPIGSEKFDSITKIDEFLLSCKNAKFILPKGVLVDKDMREATPGKYYNIIEIDINEDSTLVFPLIQFMYKLFSKKTILELTSKKVTLEIIKAHYDTIKEHFIIGIIAEVVNKLKSMEPKIRIFTSKGVKNKDTKDVKDTDRQIVINDWKTKLNELYEESIKECIDKLIPIYDQPTSVTLVKHLRRKNRKERVLEENQLQMIGLSEECLEKTRNVVISMVSGEVPDKKYAILDVSFDGFYMPTDWMRQQICTSHDIHDTFIRIDEKDFRFALNVKSKVRPFSEEDYYIKFLNVETIMEDIYNKMCADMPPEINLLSEQFFTLKQKYPDAKPIVVASVFYLFISWFDPEFQLYDERFHNKIQEIIKGDFMSNIPKHINMEKILNEHFYIHPSQDIVINDVYLYIVSYVNQKIYQRFPYFKSLKSTITPYLSPFIQIDDIFQLEQNLLKIQEQKMMALYENDSEEDSLVLENAVIRQSDSEHEYDPEVLSLFDKPEYAELFQMRRELELQPRLNESNLDDLPPLLPNEGTRKKKCYICKKSKKVIPTFQLDRKQKTWVCEKCVTKKGLKM